MTRGEFGKVMAMRLALWDNAKPLNAVQLEIWFDQLAHFSGAQVRAAMMAYSRDGQAFPPVVGQLYAKAIELADDTPDWGSAWKELRDRCGGSLGSVGSWSHPAVYRAAQLITLAEIGNSERGDAAFEAQCRGVYQDVREAYRNGKRYEGLTGSQPLAEIFGEKAQRIGALDRSG